MIAQKNKIQPEVLEAVVIRFVGDSGDGMQLPYHHALYILCCVMDGW